MSLYCCSTVAVVAVAAVGECTIEHHTVSSSTIYCVTAQVQYSG